MGRFVASIQWEGDSSPSDTAAQLDEFVQEGPTVEVLDQKTGRVHFFDLSKKED